MFCILCNRPTSCNYANINYRPFDLNQTGAEEGPELFTKKRLHNVFYFSLRSFLHSPIDSGRTGVSAVASPAHAARAWWRRPSFSSERLMADPASAPVGALIPTLGSPDAIAAAGFDMDATPDGAGDYAGRGMCRQETLFDRYRLGNEGRTQVKNRRHCAGASLQKVQALLCSHLIQIEGTIVNVCIVARRRPVAHNTLPCYPTRFTITLSW
jgi:hypothetical protein